MDALWKDKELGAAVRAKAKEKFGNEIPPTIDEQISPVIAPLREENETLKQRLAKIEEDRAAEKKAQTEADSETKLKNSLESARKSFNLTDEGYNKMIDRMKATGNFTDAEAAAAWVASTTPPPPSPGPTWGPQNADFFGSKSGDEAFKLLHSDPLAYQDSVLNEFVRDPDRFVKETFGG
jgi:hypothetical protein